MKEIIKTSDFDTWLRNLKDRRALSRILARLLGWPWIMQVMLNQLDLACLKCVLIAAQGVAFILQIAEGSLFCCYVVEIRVSKNMILKKRFVSLKNGRRNNMNKFTHYDSADYLETEEDIAAYLDSVMQSVLLCRKFMT